MPVLWNKRQKLNKMTWCERKSYRILKSIAATTLWKNAGCGCGPRITHLVLHRKPGESARNQPHSVSTKMTQLLDCKCVVLGHKNRRVASLSMPRTSVGKKSALLSRLKTSHQKKIQQETEEVNSPQKQESGASDKRGNGRRKPSRGPKCSERIPCVRIRAREADYELLDTQATSHLGERQARPEHVGVRNVHEPPDITMSSTMGTEGSKKTTTRNTFGMLETQGHGRQALGACAFAHVAQEQPSASLREGKNKQLLQPNPGPTQ